MKKILDFFIKPTSQKVLTIGQLQLILFSIDGKISYRSLFYKIKQLESDGFLEKVRGVIYINKIHPYQVMPDEIAHYVRSDAVVSLHRILGKHGILNNGTEIITCIVPIGSTYHNQYNIKNYNSTIDKVDIHFYGMPMKEYYCKGISSDLILDHTKSYPCATVEKAFGDFLYLGASKHSKLELPPLDVDLSDLNMKNLSIILNEMKIKPIFDKWLEEKLAYENDINVSENMSIEFGF